MARIAHRRRDGNQSIEPKPNRCDNAAMAGPTVVFDRQAVRRHRNRSARVGERATFLYDEIADRLVERLDDIQRQFPRVLVLGALSDRLCGPVAARAGVEHVVVSDGAEALVRYRTGMPVVADEEAIPFAAASFDLVLGGLTLHAVNDLPGALAQIRRVLVEDGLFLGACFGGETLQELRRVMLEAESEVEDGASPRVAPFADIRDGGTLLQRAGFALPVADNDILSVTWPDAFALMRDLRAMGEGNALAARRRAPTPRPVFAAAAARYVAMFGDADGRIPATFQILYLTGWSPAASQQQPLRPGTAAARLAEALDTEERSAGERTGPDRQGPKPS